MKTVLAAVNAKFIHSALAVRYLKAYTENLDYECKIIEFSINDSREKVIQQLILEAPDIIGFSCYIWNIDFIKYIALHIKLINPDIKILYGGPEVSYDPDEFLKNNPGEFIIQGEGEETYHELIELMISNVKYTSEAVKDSNIKGLYFRDGEHIQCAGKRAQMDMNNIVFPYGDLIGLENKIIYYEASRGCPFLCKYCLSSTSHGVRFLDFQRVKKELDFFINNKVNLVKFVDRTFNCNKKFAMAIWSYLIEKAPDTRFHFEISADLLDKDELELLSRARPGLFQFEVGVQTTNSEVLKNINRYVSFEDIKKTVVELEKLKNIKQHLDLIAGLPGENIESFKESFNEVYSIKPEELQLGFLKLLKGSDMRKEAEHWGMVYSPEPPYEILKTNTMSYLDIILLKRVEEVLDKYYNSNKFDNILNFFIPRFNSAFDFYMKLGDFFNIKGYFNKNISNAQYYKIFIDFYEFSFNEESLILKELIKFDYLRFNKRKWLPDFLCREIDKEQERILKDLIKEQKLQTLDRCHMEKFFIDIIKYIETGYIEKSDTYILFDEQGDIYSYGGKGNIAFWR